MKDIIVQGENGYEYTCAEDFLHCIDAFVDDPEWRIAAGQRSQEIAASFDKSEFGSAMEKVYESVLA